MILITIFDPFTLRIIILAGRYRGYCIVPASWTYKGNSKRITGRELVITNFEAGMVSRPMALPGMGLEAGRAA